MASVLPILLAFAGRAVVRSKNRFARVAFTASLLLFFATAVSYGRNPDLPSPYAAAIRNFYLPMVFLLWSLIAITRFDRRRIAVWTVVFAWSAVQIAFIPETRNLPDLRWEVYAERLKSGEAMKIPITPAGWNMELRERTPR
jgi:hypothetical protein